MTKRDDLGADDWLDRCRKLFLTDLWSLLVDEDERVDGQPGWIESWFRSHQPGVEPSDATAAALFRILAAGADADDLTDVVRTMQLEIIFNACKLLDDPTLLGIRLDSDAGDDLPPGQAEPGWELMAVRTAASADRRPIGWLHEDLYDHDPSGRYGEPRGRPIPAPLPGQPYHARLAVAQARAGDRLAAIRTWRAATGATSSAAEAAIDALLDDAEG